MSDRDEAQRQEMWRLIQSGKTEDEALDAVYPTKDATGKRVNKNRRDRVRLWIRGGLWPKDMPPDLIPLSLEEALKEILSEEKATTAEIHKVVNDVQHPTTVATAGASFTPPITVEQSADLPVFTFTEEPVSEEHPCTPFNAVVEPSVSEQARPCNGVQHPVVSEPELMKQTPSLSFDVQQPSVYTSPPEMEPELFDVHGIGIKGFVLRELVEILDQIEVHEREWTGGRHKKTATVRSKILAGRLPEPLVDKIHGLKGSLTDNLEKAVRLYLLVLEGKRKLDES